MRCPWWDRLFPLLETQAPATDLDLISFLRAIPDTRMRRGIRIPAWYLLLVDTGSGRSADPSGCLAHPETVYRGNGAGVMGCLRTVALNLLRLGGFASIRSGMQRVSHDITVMLEMARRRPELSIG